MARVETKPTKSQKLIFFVRIQGVLLNLEMIPEHALRLIFFFY